jgi:hypothetical protein
VSLAKRPTALVACAAVALVLPLTACGSDTDSATSSSPSASVQAAAVTLSEGWVKAADTGMTAMFGVLTNSGDADVTLVAGTSPAAAKVEVHEMAMVDGSMVMRPKAGGIVIPAKGTHELKPGGDHVMLMGITAPIKPGQDVTVTLSTAQGSTVTLTAQAKTYAGGNETYMPSGSPMPSMAPNASMSPMGSPSTAG